jgi:radical SAM protein with 4Fe4S-binding SPASM domain
MRFFMCYFETTRECNQDCPGCMTRTDGPAAPSLSTGEAKALVIDEVAKICPTGSVAFSGGEFLLRTDALDLLAHAAARGLHAFVNTNGLLLEPGLIGEIKRASQRRVTFGFSLDSVDPDVQSRCRSGGKEDLLRRAAMCDEAGVGYFVLVTVSRANMATLAETSEFLREHGIPMIRSPFVPRGAAAARRDLMFTRDDMEKTIHPVLRANPLAYVSHTPFFAPPGATRVGLSKLGISLSQLGCQAARGFVGVSPEGDVAPCVHLLDSAAVCGNVKRTPLSELFSTNPVLCALREGCGLKGRCGRCRYRTACGGCRALAYYSSGDCFAEDPTCFFEPSGEEDRSEHEDETGRNMRSFIEFVASNPPWRDIFTGGLSGRIGASIIRSAAVIRDIARPLRAGSKHENTAD